MTDKDEILAALRKVYAQNQELEKKLDSLTTYLQGALGTITHDYPHHDYPKKTSSGKRPWEQGWSKDKVEQEPEQIVEGEPVSDEDIPNEFKF